MPRAKCYTVVIEIYTPRFVQSTKALLQVMTESIVHREMCPNHTVSSFTSPSSSSISINSLPSSTISPLLHPTDLTTPFLSALMTVSVFMLSSTTTACPFSTRSPTFTLTSTTRLGIGAFKPPLSAPRISPPRDRSHLGDGSTSVIFWPPTKRCRRSMVLCDVEAGVVGDGFWDTIVVSLYAFPIRNDSLVGDVSRAVIDAKVVGSPPAFTVRSNRFEPTAFTDTLTADLSPVSSCSVINRSYTSPPNRRECRVVHGVLFVFG
ncbi:hypothetical protein CPB85DRAFT_885944 [Mucidula mucida]|nr:hypothetical protein CPB85DRAFT_885944 [Mucidula mucida]